MPDRLCLAPCLPTSILVVGSVAYDSIATPKHSVERVLGGSASYAAVAASYFAPVRLVGVAGRDFLLSDRARFERRGIDLSGFVIDSTAETFFWRGRYFNNFKNRETLDTQLNAFERFAPDLPSEYSSSEYVFLGNISPHLQHQVIDQLHGAPFIVADTMNFWIRSDERRELDRLLERIDCLIINDEEAAEWTQETNMILAGRILQQKGASIIVIKKAEHGCMLFYDQKIFFVPPYPVMHVEDPTGAGDTFAGAFIGTLAALGEVNFSSLKEALRYATAAASLVIEGFSCDRLERGGSGQIMSRAAILKEMMLL